MSDDLFGVLVFGLVGRLVTLLLKPVEFLLAHTLYRNYRYEHAANYSFSLADVQDPSLTMSCAVLRHSRRGAELRFFAGPRKLNAGEFTARRLRARGDLDSARQLEELATGTLATDTAARTASELFRRLVLADPDATPLVDLLNSATLNRLREKTLPA